MQDSDVKYLVVHCSATPPNMDIGVRAIDQWHRDRGWRKVGYHYIIRRNGSIETGRLLNQVGAHTKGHNRNSWGICMVGGVDENGNSEDNFTSEQYASLRILLDGLRVRVPQAEVLGHRDLSPDTNNDGVISKWEWLKDCPCFTVRDWYWQQVDALPTS